LQPGSILENQILNIIDNLVPLKIASATNHMEDIGK